MTALLEPGVQPDTRSPQNARRRLYDILRGDISFEEKAEHALELGREYLGVDAGYLTRIDPETDHWEVMVSTEPADGDVPAGLETDLATTYCRKTFTAEQQVAFYDAEQERWADDIAVTTYGLHCYLLTRRDSRRLRRA